MQLPNQTNVGSFVSPDKEEPDVDGDDEVAVEEDEEPQDDVGHDHVDVHEDHGPGAGEFGAQHFV